MSDARYVYVGEWADIERTPESGISDRDKQRVATIFTEQSWDHVVWIPGWLLEDKDVETVESSDHLAVGDVDDYSEKAWRLWQPHRNEGAIEPNEFLPKSEVVVFERARGVETIETPQQGLAAFAGGDGGGE